VTISILERILREEGRNGARDEDRIEGIKMMRGNLGWSGGEE
jgi:hypothetical protein